jgi:hypothetical protein
MVDPAHSFEVLESSLSPTQTLPERRRERAASREPQGFARFRAGLYSGRRTYVAPSLSTRPRVSR